MSYVHSKFDEYIAILQVPNATNSGNASVPVDVAGNWLPRAPRITANLGASYETTLAAGKLAVSGNLFLSGKYFWEPGNREQLKQSSYEVLNALASWTEPSERFRFTVFGKNLTNQLYQLYVAPSRAGDRFSYQAQRTYGVRVEFFY